MALTLTEENGIYKFKGRTFKQTEEKNTLLAPLNKMVFNYGIQLDLLPTPEQMTMIDRTIGCARVAANNYFALPKNKTIDNIIPDNNTRITSVTVVHNSTVCYISLQMETIIDLVNIRKSVCRSHIGSMDMGLKDFGIYGDGENTLKIDNPRWIKKAEKKLRRAQKALSRKYEAAKKEERNYWEGKNYQKAKAKVAKIHRHIANQRKDFHHKLSRIIADTYDAFIFENLNIKGLLKNHKLAKSISSVGWYQFQQFVKYKIERKGGTVLKIDRFFPSSKTCSKCGYKKKDLELSERYWYCPKCKTLHDRDINAKDNILKEGIRIMESSGYTILPA